MSRHRCEPDASRAWSKPGPPSMVAGARGPASGLASRPVLLAILALLWVLLQSGRKPSRIAYPCQQAALHVGWIGLAIALAPAIARLARRGTRLAVGSTALGVLLFGGLSDTSGGASVVRHSTPMAADGRDTVFVADSVEGRVGDHHDGIDRLLAGMGEAGLKFYRSATVGAESGPAGIVAAGDVVLVKVNQQWPERGGTNTDVLEGLIARILEHPDGFHGEVVVVENGQGMGSLDWPASNAEDHGQSVQDVVDHFAGAGKPVSAYLWDDIRTAAVDEYASGDLRDGYVLGALDQGSGVRISYPKFRTVGGHRISLRNGVWNEATSSYDDARLKFLAVPVLKCHSTYGVTAATKLHVGTMTTGLSTNTHSAVATGGLGAFLAEVRMPDLSILDCTYVLAIPGGGPAATYAEASRVDQLVAGRDPVALDLWAAANVLVPAIRANGYTSYPEQDPANAGGDFRRYLDATAARLLASGIPVVNDLALITAVPCRASGGVPPTPRVSLGPYPNPFASATVLRFRPVRSGETRLAIYELGGRLRRSIAVSATAGVMQEIGWDGNDDDGRAVPPGTYYYRVVGPGEAMSGKVTRLR